MRAPGAAGHLLDTVERPRGRGVEEGTGLVRAAVGEAQGDPGRRWPWRGRRGGAAARSSVGVEAYTARIVSLNCRTLAKPGGERDLRDRQAGRLEQDARGVGALGAGQGDRSGAHLGR